MKYKITAKIALEHLLEVLLPLGYQYVKDSYFISICVDFINQNSFYRLSIDDSSIYVKEVKFRIDEVEEIIEQIFPSVEHGTSYTFKIPAEDYKSILLCDDLFTPESVHEACKKVTQFILSDDNKKMLEYYSCLPNLLRKLDEEWSQHISYWSYASSSVMCFAAFDIRRVIISRLCNDPDYERKLTKAEYIANKNENLERLQSIKDFLATIEPRYRME